MLFVRFLKSLLELGPPLFFGLIVGFFLNLFALPSMPFFRTTQNQMPLLLIS